MSLVVLVIAFVDINILASTLTSLLSTMTKSKPLFFILKTEEGGRAGHPFGFLLIQLLLCLMVILPGGMTL